MPFASKAQARYLHARHPGIAARWEKHTPAKKRRALPEHVGKAGETKVQRYQRHQRQAAAAITATTAIPALLALRSGRMATLAGAGTAEHALHSGTQLRHAATATGLGGLAGATNALPTPKRFLQQNKHNQAPKKPAASGYVKTGITAKRDTTEVGRAMTYIDAFGVARDDLVAKADKKNATSGRLATGALFPGVHGAVAGKPGKKLKAAGTELGIGLAGGMLGHAIHPAAATAGNLVGAAAGTNIAHNQGYLKPQKTRVIKANRKTPSVGRLATGGVFPGFHGAVAGKPGQYRKLKAAGTELGSSTLGSAVGHAVGGPVGSSAGNLAGAVGGTAIAHNQGWLKRQKKA
jgi:hypothetical protein